MSKRQPIDHVEVWCDYHGDTRWSVSLCAEDGDEISCEGGDDDLIEAWRHGCDLADQYGIQCIEYAIEGGQATGLYTPEGGKE